MANEDKGIVYCPRVLQGNWYETAKLEEYKTDQFLNQMKSGKLQLARYRIMRSILDTPITLTQATGSIRFGAKISLLAPHVAASDPPEPNKKGVLLGGRIGLTNFEYTYDLRDGSTIVGFQNLTPVGRSAFVITSADYCDRTDEVLKYNQEFMLVLASSVDKTPLYIRYDPNPIPGVNDMFPVYLSKHPVANARWRVLPVQRNDITRFEQEGLPVKVNEDVIINHCSTNTNLAINAGHWAMGFYRKLCSIIVKTILDVHKCEVAENIWQIYTTISE